MHAVFTSPNYNVRSMHISLKVAHSFVLDIIYNESSGSKSCWSRPQVKAFLEKSVLAFFINEFIRSSWYIIYREFQTNWCALQFWSCKMKKKKNLHGIYHTTIGIILHFRQMAWTTMYLSRMLRVPSMDKLRIMKIKMRRMALTSADTTQWKRQV